MGFGRCFMKKSNFGVGALVLLLSGLVCKTLGAFFRLPLTNLVGIEGIGMFQLVMSLYSFALVLTCGGVTNSLSKLISSARARGEYEKISIYLLRAFFVSVSIALAIGLVFLLFGKSISNFQGIGENKSYGLFLAMLPLGAGLSVFRGYFQGYENMLPTAISQVLEQVAKFALGLSLAFLFGKDNTSMGVFGAFLGITLSELVAVVFLFILFFAKKGHTRRESDRSFIKQTKREFDGANFLLTLSASVLPLVNAFDGLVIVQRLMIAGFSNTLATKLYGLQSGIVGALLNFPLIISMAVTTTLLPNISYLISRGTGGKIIIEKGLKILLFLILPTTFGLVAISKDVFALFYNDMSGQILDVAFELMFYGGFSIVFTAVMQYLIMLLQANGEFRYILTITALAGSVKALLSFFLSALPNFGIFALVIGNIALSGVVCVLALVKLKKIVSFKLSISDIFVTIFGTLCMFLVVYTFVNCNYFSTIPNILVAVVLGVFVYFVLTIPFSWKLKNEFQRKKV